VFNSRQGGKTVLRSKPVDGSGPGDTLVEKSDKNLSTSQGRRLKRPVAS
jgi:hypothetical protein